MIDIGTLDTIIAMVIVLLVLSLLVQSIQALIKKILKLKSTVVMNSMVDLFEYVGSKKLIGKEPQEFVDLVKAEFQKLGRENIRGKLMLDTISKDDLLKIVDRIVQTNPDFERVKSEAEQFKAELANWFDAVMQSFEERYTRNMKTVAVAIAFVVVVVLNANFFTVYRNIATSDLLRAAILRLGPEVQKQAESSRPAGSQARQDAATNPSATPSPSPAPSPLAGAAGTVAQPPTGESGSAAKKSDEQVKANIKENAEQIQQFVNDYKGLGFTPLKPQQISNFFKGEGDWKESTAGERFSHLLKVLLGWGIMTLLLSVGAPFWEDALGSLFGVKSLLQKQSKTGKKEGAQS